MHTWFLAIGVVAALGLAGPAHAARDDLTVVKAFIEAAENHDAAAAEKLLAADYRSLAPAPEVGADIPAQSRSEVVRLMRQSFETMREKGVETETEIVGTEPRDGGLVVEALTTSSTGSGVIRVRTRTLYRIDGGRISATRMLAIDAQKRAFEQRR